ncbi:hypothetical protein MalM25_16380 [Planctomycetes bacterium MalM25]|nr:hypothetical protein MalM25_16380 [Planctomycetes bacterium MalM25]
MTTSLRTTNDRRRRGGFTLVELLLVLALAVVLASLAAPSLSGTLARVRLDAAADEVREAWNDARLEAIRTGEPVAFQCQLGTGRYTLSTLADAAAAQSGSTEVADQGALADDEYEDLGEVNFVQLSRGVEGDAEIDPTIADCLVFRPDGGADDAFAIVRSSRGSQRKIVLRGLTGAARIDDGYSVEEE